MNAKQTRKYELIVALAHGGAEFMNNLQELCAIDFTTAFEVWEWDLARGGDSASVGFDLFNRVSELKTRQLFCESLPLQKLVYSSPQATEPVLIDFLVNLVLLNKIDVAEECLMRLRTNTHIDFNEVLLVVVNNLFATYCARNNTRVPSFNKKQKTMLLESINKIKNPNKALLLQRMKEI